MDYTRWSLKNELYKKEKSTKKGIKFNFCVDHNL